MHRYYFNFRQGDEVSRDRVGMHLPDLDAARAEALYAWGHVVEMGADIAPDCEIQVADDSGDTLLSISLGEQTRLH